jgi:hypothetical protein
MRRVVATLAAGLALAGCVAKDAPPGTVHGHIVGVGGPPGADDSILPGIVEVTRGGRTVASQTVVQDAEFRFSLAPGKYHLANVDKDISCMGVDVTVESASDQEITITCPRK